MKKLLSVLLAVVFAASAFVFTANAAENEWEAYASVGAYKEESEYESDNDRPKVPGLRYTDMGVQMYSASKDMLEAMGASGWGGLMLKEKVDLSNGFKMTALIDKYTEADKDKWIAFCIWTDPRCTPGDTTHGKGWYVLARPKGTTFTLQSCIDQPIPIAQPQVDVDFLNGEALVLEVRKEDGKLKIYVNDQDMKADSVFSRFENNEAYVSIVLHQAVREEVAVTITDVNGVKPTGNESYDPYVSPDAKPREPGPEVPVNEPCWRWDSSNVKKGNPGEGMTSVASDDGSLHITFTDAMISQFNPTVKKYLYNSEEFPVFAMKFKGLDEIIDSAELWYCAGEIVGADNNAHTTLDFYDTVYPTEGGWGLLTYDLTGENNWEGDINGFRLDLFSTGGHEGEEFDLEWFGFFRSEKEAYYYAEMAEYWDANFETETEAATEKQTEAPVETNAPDTQQSGGEETKAPANDTKPADTKEAGKPAEQPKSNTWLIIVIIAAVVVAAGVACFFIFKKKK
ncbi:MAG: DUF4366 domain-containing protein [Clostridia bacterium]|nr:DUF4366 domain-containing protein [Clostridia bacterium]